MYMTHTQLQQLDFQGLFLPDLHDDEKYFTRFFL